MKNTHDFSDKSENMGLQWVFNNDKNSSERYIK